MNTDESALSTPATGIDAAIAKVKSIYKNWNRETTMQQMRADWDSAFYADLVPCNIENVEASGVPCRWLTATGSDQPADCAMNERRVILYLHGGGFKMGSFESHHDFMAQLSLAVNCAVFAVDYRLVPEHRYPAALEDCVAAYLRLLDQGCQAKHISIAGDSAGGGLVASVLLALRAANKPMPVSAVMISPLTDLTASGESYENRAAADPIHQRVLIQALAKSYLNKDDNPKDPLASPLFADLQGLPPLLIQVGDRETGLSDSTDFAKKAAAAGVDVQISVWNNMIHFFQQFTQELPESAQAVAEIAAFLKKHWS